MQLKAAGNAGALYLLSPVAVPGLTLKTQGAAHYYSDFRRVLPKGERETPGREDKWSCNYAGRPLNCHSEGDFGGHPFKEISVMSYNEPEKSYVYFETNSNHESDLWHGKVDGDTWTWTEKGIMHGKPTQTRFTQRFRRFDTLQA